MRVVEPPIVAISSPPGRSARGLVRLSGDDLDRCLPDLLHPMPHPPRHLRPARLRLWPGPTGRPCELACLAVLFPSDHSFTGQQVLEIQVPGNPALLARLQEHLLHRVPGLRLAEPGQFTRRAFLNGRIDLTQAEGIAATISAVADAQLQAAALLRQGRLGRWSGQLVEQLAQALALVEAGIDFTDQEDVVPIGPLELDRRLAGLLDEVRRMLDRSRPWSALQALPHVVLAGAPNVGKSSLFNALLGRDRAVTSPAAGTTRDVLAEPLRLPPSAVGLPPAEVMLVDLAGLEPDAAAAGDRLAGAMQQAARQALGRADLVLLLDDGLAAPLNLPISAPCLNIRTKADLSACPAAGREERRYDLAVSARTGQGLERLKAMLARCLHDRAVTLAGQVLALQDRHLQALHRAAEQLAAARQLLAAQHERAVLDEAELVAGHMRWALDSLAELGGRMSPDDVIGRVFATFCIGK